MPKRKSSSFTGRRRKPKVTEEMRRFLMMEPEEMDFSDDPLIRKIEEAFEGLV